MVGTKIRHTQNIDIYIEIIMEYLQNSRGLIKGVIPTNKTFDMCYHTLKQIHRHKYNKIRPASFIFKDPLTYERRPFALSFNIG
jgi:hypothetical protein